MILFSQCLYLGLEGMSLRNAIYASPEVHVPGSVGMGLRNASDSSSEQRVPEVKEKNLENAINSISETHVNFLVRVRLRYATDSSPKVRDYTWGDGHGSKDRQSFFCRSA